MNEKLKQFIGEKVIYDESGQMIFGTTEKDGMQLLLGVGSVRGWGAIQHLFKDEKDAAKFQDELGEFIRDAINEKLNSISPEVTETKDWKWYYRILDEVLAEMMEGKSIYGEDAKNILNSFAEKSDPSLNSIPEVDMFSKEDLMAYVKLFNIQQYDFESVEEFLKNHTPSHSNKPITPEVPDSDVDRLEKQKYVNVWVMEQQRDNNCPLYMTVSTNPELIQTEDINGAHQFDSEEECQYMIDLLQLSQVGYKAAEHRFTD